MAHGSRSRGSYYGRLKAAAKLGAVAIQYMSTFYVFSKYGFFVSKVTGPSMYPTFSGRGDFVIAEGLSPMLGGLRLGDIVICSRPVDPSETIIKRVAACAGDEVLLYPNAEHSDIRRLVVPAGHIFLQGDNLSASLDSRQYGPVPVALVRGRVILQVWPQLRTSEDLAMLPHHHHQQLPQNGK